MSGGAKWRSCAPWAPARPCLLLLVAEAALVALAGAVLGAIATYGALNALAPLLEARFGILLPGLRRGYTI
ncbi:MAG: hypothetical protein JKP95_02850 [Oceanicaulis sp.]|nr:hypothetical protein [Oceanicaulis sp.]